jgi:hypothetical protein
MEGISTLNADSLPSEELDIVIKFVLVREMDGDAA